MSLNLIIDSSSLIFRAFYAVFNRSHNNINPSINLYRSWLNRLSIKFNSIKDIDTKLFCAIDKNNRNSNNFKLLNSYKEGRSTPQLLKENFDKFHQAEEELGYKVIGIDGEEADDVAASLSEELYLKNDNYKGTFIVTADRDLFQLANKNKKISIIRPESQNHKTNFNIYNEQKVCNYFNINVPLQVCDYKALAGDGSDGYKGVKGIGNKRALSLINKYNSIDGIYNHINEIKGKQKEYLINGKNDAYTCLKLATLNKNLLKTNDIKL